MVTITVVSLTTPDTMTAQSMHVLKNAERLFLQTTRHPSARIVLDLDKAFTSMDDLYDACEDFDTLNRDISMRLLDAGTCVYAVTGNITISQLPVMQTLAEENGVEIQVLPAVTLTTAAFPALPAARVVTASNLPERLQPSEPIAVEEIDDVIRAGEVKLKLGEYFPDDWTVHLSLLTEDGVFTYRDIPLYELDRQKAYSAATLVYVPSVPFEGLTRYGYWELVDVIKRLRAPDGCPWDREQTHESLKEPLLEECYELLDALDDGDDMHICEELGDVLLQVVMHAEIATEQGRFTEHDINDALVKKLVYRHPHVFGDTKASTSEEVLVNWDKLKKTEKAQKTQTDVLRSVPRNLPSLTYSCKVQKKAANVGFDWSDAEAALPKVTEETDELLRAMHGDGDVGEELGDLLFSAVNVARLLHLNPELLLRAAADKFIERFSTMESLASSSGHILEEMSLAEMDRLWEAAKLPKESKEN